jgi:hypothetical protein
MGDSLTDLPIACSLTGADVGDRLAAWAVLRRDALLAETVEELRSVSTYALLPGVHERLSELVAAEGRCCPYLRFEIVERPDDIELTITAPAGAEDAFGVLLARAG